MSPRCSVGSLISSERRSFRSVMGISAGAGGRVCLRDLLLRFVAIADSFRSRDCLSRVQLVCRLLHDHGFRIAGGGVENEERLLARAMKGAGIDHPSRTCVMLLGDVAVAVEEIVVLLTLFELVEKTLIVAVNEG